MQDVPSETVSRECENGTILSAGEPRSRVTLSRNPVVVAKWGLSSGLLCPPIGLAYLGGALRQHGYEVSIVDPVGEAPFETHPVEGHPLLTYGWTHEQTVDAFPSDTKYLGLSCMFSQEWPIFKRLVSKARAKFPDATIIIGGEHVTAVPDFCLENCGAIDFAVFGEGEETIVELIDALEKGEDLSGIAGVARRSSDGIIKASRRQRIRDVNSIVRPAWDLTPIESYLDNHLHYGVGHGRTMPIISTRGCPFQCTFCSSPNMWTTRWSARDVTDVVNEMETYVESYGVESFDFYDLTAVVKKDWIKEFCKALIARDLNVTWQMPAGTRSEAIDDEVARLLAEAGHRNLVYAPESGSTRILELIQKKVKIPRMLDSMRASTRNGISVKLNMITGFPDETWGDLWESLKFIVKCAWIGVDDVTLAIFSPYPGSALFDRLQEEGKIRALDDDAFFFDLATINDAKEVVSYCDNLGPKTLGLYKTLSYLTFYASRFLFRPWRIFELVWHLHTGQHKTRLEKALSAMADKMFSRQRKASPERTT